MYRGRQLDDRLKTSAITVLIMLDTQNHDRKTLAPVAWKLIS